MSAVGPLNKTGWFAYAGEGPTRAVAVASVEGGGGAAGRAGCLAAVREYLCNLQAIRRPFT